MTLAAFLAALFLTACVVLIIMGAAIRPSIVALRHDRDAWRDRALSLQEQLDQAHQALGDRGLRFDDVDDPLSVFVDRQVRNGD